MSQQRQEDLFGGSTVLLEPQRPARQPMSHHPLTCVAHIFFKIASVLAYLLLSLFVDSFVITFVVVILFLAFDFWVVKNVSGRLLVGLRWWNEITPDGKSEWRFESLEDRTQIAPFDQRFFWVSSMVMPVLWGFFAFSALFSLKLQWLLLVAVALSLAFANIVGYIRCAKDARRQLQRYAAGIVVETALQSPS
eukprot:a174855_155.p1 GENE.a174855_155~~a174855_155.p1  ORF type:complete len:203 (-),score=57.18 a174855_155:120-698(-)